MSEVDTSLPSIMRIRVGLVSECCGANEKLDADALICALAAENAALRAKIEQAEARELALVDALITIRDKRKQCNRAVDCQAVARAAITEWEVSNG